MIRKAWGGQSTAAVPLMELVTIICGIAATVAIAQLVTVTEENGIPGSKFAPLVPLLLFVSAIVTIGRFYHGNIRHLDEEYAGGRHGKGHTDRVRVGLAGRLATDFVVIASESTYSCRSCVSTASAYSIHTTKFDPPSVGFYMVLFLPHQFARK